MINFKYQLINVLFVCLSMIKITYQLIETKKKKKQKKVINRKKCIFFIKYKLKVKNLIYINHLLNIY